MTPRQVMVRSLLQRAARELGYPEGYAPSTPKYSPWAKSQGYPSADMIARRTPGQTWTAVARYAGLKPAGELWTPSSRRGKGPAPILTTSQLKRAMLDDLKRVAREIGQPGKIPPPLTYRRMGLFHEREVKRYHGGPECSWFEVAAAANLLPNRTRNGYWTKERIVATYKRVAKELGRRPGEHGLTAREVDRHIANIRTLSPYVGTPNELASLCGFLPWPSGLNRTTAAKRAELREAA